MPTALQSIQQDARDMGLLIRFSRVTNFHEASWYQREAPRIIGTKVHRRGDGYNYRMPAINGVITLGVSEESSALWGRIGLSWMFLQSFGMANVPLNQQSRVRGCVRANI